MSQSAAPQKRSTAYIFRLYAITRFCQSDEQNHIAQVLISDEGL